MLSFEVFTQTQRLVKLFPSSVRGPSQGSSAPPQGLARKATPSTLQISEKHRDLLAFDWYSFASLTIGFRCGR